MLLRRLLCLSAVILSFVHPASGDVGGRISGVVKDQSNAAVPGAIVVMLNTATGVKQTTTADSEGLYSFPLLPVGKYDIEISFQGFRAYRRTGLLIDVNSALQVDVMLQVGDYTESVTVSEGAVHIETADTEMGQTITAERVTEVPLNGRSYTNLLAIQPGITPVNTSASTNSSSGGGFGAVAPSGSLDAGQFSVSGQRESANGFILNGANVQEGIASGAAIIPNLDSIAEFRILTSNFDAEYGNYSGGLVSVVTKSGANQFHGSAFEFLRNTSLDARGFFDPVRAKFIQNQFGGTFGGPIKQNGIFFLADYQGTRNIQGLGTGNLPVPSLQNRAGNFLGDQNSQGFNPLGFCGTNPDRSVIPCVVTGSHLANLLSQRLGYPVPQGRSYFTATCNSSSECVFPGAVIPQSAWSIPAQRLLQYIPAPNSGSNLFTSAAEVQRLGDDKGALRLDAASRLGMLSAYYLFDQYNLDNPYPTQQGGANVPGFNSLSDGRAQFVNLSDTKSFGATAVNELRVSYVRSANNLGQQKGGVGVSLASQGFAVGGSGIVVGSPSTEGVASIAFNKITFGTSPFALVQTNNNYQLLENFSKVTGNHSVKLGGQFLYQAVKLLPDFTANGQFQFFGSATGLDFADFLLGLPSAYNQGFSPAFYQRSRYAGLYAQDSWRLTPNLTFNYGLRWDMIMPWYEQHNQTGTLILGQRSQLFPGAPTGYVFPGDPGVPRTIAPTPYNDFSPRLGIAYSPAWKNGLLAKLTGGQGKSSIRAGVGRFFTAIEGQTLAFQTGNAPYGLTYVSPEPPLFETPFIGAMTGTQYPQQFPVKIPPYNVSPANPFAGIDWAGLVPLNGIDAYLPKNRTPYSENYFISFQRQLGSNTVLTASYIGSQGHHLIVLLPANPGNPALCLSVSRRDQVAPESDTCGLLKENRIFTTRSGQVINGTRQPFGNNFGSVVYFAAMGNSAYNSLQVSLKHTSATLTILGGYTYGKSLDQSSNLGEQVHPFDYKRTRAISSFDLRHNFVASYRYQLPLDKIFRHANRLTQGWAVSGITRFSTGIPVTLFNFNDTSLIGSGNNGVNGVGIDLPDFAPGSLQLNHNPRDGKSYFNTSLFSLPALGTSGTSPRRFFYGPGIENFDVALLKDTRLTESKSLEFRLETFNTFNHAQFYGANSVDGNFSSATFGNVLSAAPPRLAQMALKFHF